MTGRYGFAIMRAIRLAGVATVLALGAFIFIMVLRDGEPIQRRAPARRAAAPGAPCPLAEHRTARSTDHVVRNLPLFPEQRLHDGRRVDALYFFLVGICVFFSLLIAGLIVFFAVKYRRRSPTSVGAPIHGGLVARAHLDGDPAPDHAGDLRLGRQRLLRDVAPAGTRR